ncbi:MAG: porin [Ferruginibacter sp.]
MSFSGKAQFLMDMVDTSKDMGKGMLSIYQKFDKVRISGYIQPQFQVASEKGIKSFSGGDFAPLVNNRFMLRRGRIRFDYIHFAERKGPSVQFVFQFDGTERGVVIRDFWGRILENKYSLFAVTTGMFARPFSYELNLSSSDRESPERGRLSQLLLKTERDLGAMVSFEPRKKDHPLYNLKLDAGIFNGQGLAAIADFDSHKDVITRLSVKPVALFKNNLVSAGISYLNGGLVRNTRYRYTTQDINGIKMFVVDSALSNQGKIAPRKYYGGDVQIKFLHSYGFTEVRAEFIKGKQTAQRTNTETPFLLLTGIEGYYTRKFNGAYFYLLQHIHNSRHQLVIKYDWYDPNTEVKKTEIGKNNSNLNAADIKYSTWGFGYLNYINLNLKMVLWYDIVKNEKTSLAGFLNDIKDNVFTFRLQFRF